MRNTTVGWFFVLAVASYAVGARAATVTVGTGAGNCGSTVSVPVTVSGVSGLLAVQFKVTYDAAKLTPANPAAAAGAMTQAFSISSNAAGGAVTVALASGTPASGDSGTVATLLFTIPAGASPGPSALTISDALVNDEKATLVPGGVNVSCGGLTGPELVLSEGRVAVTLTWRSQYSGATGKGTPVKQMDQYGYFWFDSASNPEVFIKVLDFGGDSFLVFHSSLSDLEYTATFTVLRTGVTYPFKRDSGSVCGLANGSTVKK